jgi:hypothetical protein
MLFLGDREMMNRLLLGSVIALAIVSLVTLLRQPHDGSSTSASVESGRTAGAQGDPAMDEAEHVTADGIATPEHALNDPRFRLQLLEIAKDYKTYDLANTAVLWAGADCIFPAIPSVKVVTPAFSQSREGTAHGGKLFFLFARDGTAYSSLGKAPQPIGQALVKQAWRPVKVDAKRFASTTPLP